MAKPRGKRKPARERRRNAVLLYLTDEERAALDRAADLTGLTLSETIRRALAAAGSTTTPK